MAQTPATKAQKALWIKNMRSLVGRRTERAIRAPLLIAEAIPAQRIFTNANWFVRTLIAFVIAPTIAFFLYVALWHSDIYVAETRLAVRAKLEQKQQNSEASEQNRGSSAQDIRTSAQDSYIVLNYIKSAAVLLDLGGAPYLEKQFGDRSVDYFSRLASGAKLEEQLKYWRRHVTASVDVMSGILTVKIEAFRPQDATNIAKDLVRLSESLLNDISLRNRRDSIQRAEHEVDLAARNLADAREKVTLFREQNVLIDPRTRGQSIAELIGALTLDKVSIENSLATLKGIVEDNSPTQRIQRTRLAAIEKQIAEYKKSLTDSSNNNAVSAQIGAYEKLKLDEQFAQAMYTITQTAFQRARQELDKQQLYLVVVVPPALPETPTFPKVFASTLLTLVLLFIVWSIGALVTAGVNDHML